MDENTADAPTYRYGRRSGVEDLERVTSVDVQSRPGMVPVPLDKLSFWAGYFIAHRIARRQLDADGWHSVDPEWIAQRSDDLLVHAEEPIDPYPDDRGRIQVLIHSRP